MLHLERSELPGLVRLLAVLFALCTVACGGPGRVDYDGGRCLKDGRPLTVSQVEEEQANVASRIASRQPWFAVITIGVVVVAVGSNAQRALLLLRARHAHGQSLADRVREALARQRDNPVLIASILATSLILVAIGGGFYIYLDIDKRASERALGMLQFCHLAMRTQQEQKVLDEQRRNLEAIQSTAGDIRTLVGKLPPDEQRKAQLIVSEMNDALAKQGKIVGDYAERADETQKELSEHTAAMERGLASVQGDLAGLRSLPGDVKDLETATHHIDQAMTSIDGRFDDLRAKMAGIDAKMDAVLARPACPAPAAGGLSHPGPLASSAASVSAAASAPARLSRGDADAGISQGGNP
ncbi:MAG TPA: hypothetical protein VMI75_15170 [Polyangiaceae bacterium]|nr:hypothetical protein [Polyangiaceae bacterium]